MSVTKVTSMMSTGTKGGDIPSASTLVIDTDGDYFDITGTTGITAMTVDAGRRFTLHFDGALTLTHGSSLYLPGATNFTTEANDCLSFIATAANTVRCTGYALKDGGSPVAAAGTNYAISTGNMNCTSAATTTISGISFTPKYATFLGSVDGSSAAAWGISLTGDVDYHIYDAHQAADGDYAVGSLFANLQTGGSDVLQIFCALTSDGASLTKNKVGSPSGTLYYHITFFG
jgi:hypothetical protein